MTKAHITLVATVVLVFQVAAFAPAQAVHETTTLEVTPEMETNPLTEKHVLTARVAPAPDGGAEIDFKIISGPSALSADRQQNIDNMDKPDKFCTVRAGESSCTVEIDPPVRTGTDVIVAWIDHDASNITVEADKAEEPDAGGGADEPDCPENNCGADGLGEPGATADPDSTDVVTKTWGQLGAQRPPFIDGSAEELEVACNDQKKRIDGQVVSVASGCSYGYILATEPDDALDYGAAWAQTTVNPRAGWCVVRSTTSLAPPDNSSMVEVTPSAGRNVAHRRVLVTDLIFGPQTADGTGAYLLQSFIGYPGTISRVVDSEEARVTWEGKTKNTVAQVVGMEITWDPSQEFPDFPGGTTLAHRVRRC
jgi:hypothetical protein